MYPWTNVVYVEKSKPKYGCLSFLWDVFMITITCGLWLVWIFVREMRK